MMRKIFAIIMYATILFSGCKQEKPLVLSMNEDFLECNHLPFSKYVYVNANCPWEITTSSDKVQVTPSSGKGDASVYITVQENELYEEIHHSILLQNSNRSVCHELKIVQEEAHGLEVGTVKDTIPAQGYDFHIPLSTNEEVSLMLPDWITYTTNRGLTDYIYHFHAADNRTGSIRSGNITFITNDNKHSVNVIQDSYTPEAVVIRGSLSFTTTNLRYTTMDVYPSYADLSKLKISSSCGCHVKLDGKDVKINLDNYGKHSFTISAAGKELSHTELEYFPSVPWKYTGPEEVFLGYEGDMVNWLYRSPKYVLRSSNENAIKVTTNQTFSTVGFGSSIISASIPGTQVYAEKEIHVMPFMFESRIGWISQAPEGYFEGLFSARIEGPSGMKCTGFRVADGDGNIVILGSGSIKDIGFTAKAINTSIIRIPMNWSKYNNILEALRGYTFTVDVDIHGTHYQRTVKINTANVAPY